MIYLKTPEEIELTARAAELASRTLGHLAQYVTEGVTTNFIEQQARKFIAENGGRPSCLGYHGFPAACCYEINDVVVHGFPTGTPLRSGDILGIDLVVELDGFNGDMCYTFPVGQVAPETMQLLRTTFECLQIGIKECREGNRIGDISHAIEKHATAAGYGVVREMCGHGIGKSMHEDPEIPNYGRARTGAMIRNGMILCVEPMINLGKRNIVAHPDGWTVSTRDRKPSAHYEHTIAIVDNRPRVLTSFEPIYQALGHDPLS